LENFGHIVSFELRVTLWTKRNKKYWLFNIHKFLQIFNVSYLQIILLWNNQSLKREIPETLAILKFEDIIPNDKNPRKLIICENGKFIKWVEIFSYKKKKVNNYFICYKDVVSNQLLGGNIIHISHSKRRLKIGFVQSC
jgi:hypothetical protein